MATNAEVVRPACQKAEGGVRDLAGWRVAFTEDGVFSMKFPGTVLSAPTQSRGR